MAHPIAAAGLAAGLLMLCPGEAMAQASKGFKPSVIMAPPIAPQSDSPALAPPQKIDVARAPADDMFSDQARLNLRLAQMEKKLDQIIKQNIVLKTDLDQARSRLAQLERVMDGHGKATSYSSQGYSLINMVGQILTKLEED